MIKFRAWDKNQQIMRGVRGLFWTKNNLVAHCSPMGDKFDNFFTTILNDGEYHLMQSTGLFDVNGKEIFEGDVVELHHFTENYSTGGFYEGEESLVGVVRYGHTDDEIKCFGKVYPPRWFFENRYRELDFSDLSGLHEESFKVIGDIYRNPELVEG